MYVTALFVFGLLLGEVAIKADDSIPEEYLTQVWQLKQITETLQENGMSIDAKLFSNYKVTPRISESDVSLYYYSHGNENGVQIQRGDATNLLNLIPFNLSNPTVVISHGWRNQYTSGMTETVRNAYLTKVQNLNIFAVDWDSYASKDYLSALYSVPNIGAFVGEFLNTLSTTYSYSLTQVTLVGHSLGAHVAGYAGKATNGTIGIIVGLDPAGPFYFKDNEKTRLAKTDAQYVHVIHTDAQFLGVNFNLGDSDFWPNGGFTQPECELDVFGNCAHRLSYTYFAESVTNLDFLGKQCSDYNSFVSGECTGQIGQMGGDVIDTTATGNYFLKTNLTSPYGMGPNGAQ